MLLKNVFLYLIFVLKILLVTQFQTHRILTVRAADTPNILAMYNKSNIMLQINITIGIIIKLYE